MPFQPNSKSYKSRKLRPLASLVILLLWFAALALVALNRQPILDWYKLRNYSAPASIAGLADQDTMTDYARKVFYVNQPQIQSKQDFSASCLKDRQGQEQTIVLGCYQGNQSGIFLLTVSDTRLNGVQQVTAAHEMLHAAYDRLSATERKRVNGLLEDYYKNLLKDSRINQTIEAYKVSEPNDVVNEMHSIFATEVASMPPELENYYKQYFSNRSQVVRYANQYQAVFTSRQTTLKQYEAQLAAIKLRITSQETDLKTRLSEIESRQAQLQSQRNSGDTAGYNSGVAAYNAQVDAYNAEVEQVKTLINQYNRVVALYNSLAQEQGILLNELDANAPAAIDQ